jgi:Uncharacterised nucleotidyltransferase
MPVPDGSASGTLKQIAGFGLSSIGARADHLNVPDAAWAPLLRSIFQQRLNGLALAAVEAGDLRLPADQEEQLLGHHRQAMVHALAVELEILDLASRLQQEDIRFIVLKGSAVAHTFYPDASWRPFGDFDLLIMTSDWRRTCERLADLGYRRRFLEPRAGFTERFGRTALHESPSGIEVDLHRNLAAGPFTFWIGSDDLFDHVASFSLAERSLPRLDDSLAFLHACIHAILGARPPLLLPLRDIAQIAETGTIQWELLGELAQRWKLRAVVQFAIDATIRTFGFVAPEAANIAFGQHTRRERSALNAFVTTRRNRGARSVAALAAIPSFRDRLAYMRALIIPDRAFLAEQAGNWETPTYLARWRMALRSLRRM